MSTARPTVFASVAAYCDPDAVATVRSLVENATMDVRVGVCWQGDDDTAARLRECPEVELIHLRQQDARGPAFARALVQQMYYGERWYAQFDAHMEVEPGWDAKLAQQSSLVPFKSVLTTYPQRIGDNNLGHVCIIDRVRAKSPTGPVGRPELWSLDRFEGRPLPTMGTLAAGFLWAPGRWVRHVPWDPEYYYGEEFGHAVRSWTHGYDAWHPAASVVRHRYGGSRRHHTDHPGWPVRSRHARARIATLLGRGDEAPSSLGVYGPGSKRTVESFFEWTGIAPDGGAAMKYGEWLAALTRAAAPG